MRLVFDSTDATVPRGVLGTPPPGTWRLRRWLPPSVLTPWIAWAWAVQWRLPSDGSRTQGTLPHPSGMVVVEQARVGVYGPRRTRFERTLQGSGRALGLRLRTGVIRALLPGDVADWVDRETDGAALGWDPALGSRVEAHRSTSEALAALCEGIVPVVPARPDDNVERVDGWVARVREDPSIGSAACLADRVGTSTRTLHRLFRDYVGLSPKTVIRRYRLQEAAARALEGPVDWATLATELGYYDQSHLSRDFTAVLGASPGRFAATHR